MAAATPNNILLVCSRCIRIQAVPLPGDTTPKVRFCLAEWPDRLCMFCCSCSICVDRCILHEVALRISADVHMYLYFNDFDFNRWCKAADDR